jgi:hypothetical protein
MDNQTMPTVNKGGGDTTQQRQHQDTLNEDDQQQPNLASHQLDITMTVLKTAIGIHQSFDGQVDWVDLPQNQMQGDDVDMGH